MFSHQDVWRGIDRLAQSFGYSPSGLAKKAGLDPTSFNKSKRMSPDGKPRWPSTESLAKILSVTGATMSDFISLIDADAENDNAPAHQRNIPVIGFAQAGAAGFFDEDGYPDGDSWDEVEFPNMRDTAQAGVYALRVSGDSMEPLYRDNDLIIVAPSEKIRKGDRIVVKTIEGEVMAKELVRQNAKEITLKSLNDNYEDRKISQKDIGWMARIVWISQ